MNTARILEIIAFFLNLRPTVLEINHGSNGVRPKAQFTIVCGILF